MPTILIALGGRPIFLIGRFRRENGRRGIARTIWKEGRGALQNLSPKKSWEKKPPKRGELSRY